MFRAVFSLLLCLGAGTFAAQDASVTITGDVSKSIHLNFEALAKLKPVKVTLTGHDGAKTTYEGPTIADILKEAGVEAKQHPGKAMAISVAAIASDGYAVVFGLGELTNSISGRTIILAYKADDKPLTANDGPFKVVVEGDKMPARCARMVTELRVTQLRK
jgi:hypothetical protein